MKIQSKTLHLLVTAAAIATTLHAGSASAASLVTEWSYALDDGFESWAPPAPTVTGSDNNAVLGLPTILTWGHPISGQSSMGILGPDGSGHAVGTVFTNGPAVNTVNFLHSNFVIADDDSNLVSASLISQIALQAINPANPSTIVGSLLFNLTFQETTNAEPCSIDSTVPCRDIFTLAQPAGATFNEVNGVLSVVSPFPYDGNIYQSIIHIAGLQPLEGKQCGDGSSDSAKCIGFTTEENQENILPVTMEIRTVPEPNILFVFGIGLTCMGLVASRSRRT